MSARLKRMGPASTARPRPVDSPSHPRRFSRTILRCADGRHLRRLAHCQSPEAIALSVGDVSASMAILSSTPRAARRCGHFCVWERTPPSRQDGPRDTASTKNSLSPLRPPILTGNPMRDVHPMPEKARHAVATPGLEAVVAADAVMQMNGKHDKNYRPSYKTWKRSSMPSQNVCPPPRPGNARACGSPCTNNGAIFVIKSPGTKFCWRGAPSNHGRSS